MHSRRRLNAEQLDERVDRHAERAGHGGTGHEAGYLAAKKADAQKPVHRGADAGQQWDEPDQVHQGVTAVRVLVTIS